MNHEDKIVRDIVYSASFQGGMRTGQILYNYLPTGARNALATTFIDPFYTNLSNHELYTWLNNHVVFSDDGRIIAVFNNNHFIWEES